MENKENNNKKINKPLLWVVLFICIMALWAAITPAPAEIRANPSIPSEPPSSKPATSGYVARTHVTEWSYQQRESEMGLGGVNIATIQSSNTVSFGFPYQGPQRATLSIRTHPQYGKDVYFSIERGQILVRSYNDDTVILRFDNNKPIRVRALEPKDNDSTTIFLMGYNSLVAQMKKAKLLRIQVPVYQEGEPVFEFDIEGLNWPIKK